MGRAFGKRCSQSFADEHSREHCAKSRKKDVFNVLQAKHWAKSWTEHSKIAVANALQAEHWVDSWTEHSKNAVANALLTGHWTKHWAEHKENVVLCSPTEFKAEH